PARGIYSHIIGIDLVRTAENEFFVLEDNTRTPSGVSYMLENPETMMHMFPELFSRNRVQAVEDYPESLRLTLESVAPDNLDRAPTCVVLTP
ncbi:circularly permuted type 2 ATP-grasp protein, partial [Streptomyces turgidiscabies]|uniref:circularly permuted type 2 ATP-grasp protein n=1 Tax=Streptomyces turgidiscabies TaxID=85558 RepID=UPI0038F78F6E